MHVTSVQRALLSPDTLLVIRSGRSSIVTVHVADAVDSVTASAASEALHKFQVDQLDWVMTQSPRGILCTLESLRCFQKLPIGAWHACNCESAQAFTNEFLQTPAL